MFPFFPFFGGGFSLPSAPAAEESAALQSQETDSTASEAERSFRAMQAAPASIVETSQPSPGATEQYVFVRRDGTLFFAVAYAWEDGNLRYVTNEGLRRSVAREALDLAATQQFNEQRGLVFRLPA